MRMRWVVVVFLVSALYVLPNRANAQSHADLVWDQLKRAYSAAEEAGFGVRNYIVGKLDDDETDSWTIHLYGGNRYVVTGACDADCEDIDIQILNASGVEIARDNDRDNDMDDLPVVEVKPRSSGRFSIRVTMYKCTVDPCYWGIALFYQ